jgi:anti-sigma B factor antagonist
MMTGLLENLTLDPVENVKISFQKERNEVISFDLAGYIDTYNAGKFATEVMKVIALGSYKLLFDLSKVSYISSFGIGVFIDFMRKVKKHGGDVALLNPQRNVEEVFSLLGFAEFLNLMHSTKDELIDSLFSRDTLSNRSFPHAFRCQICDKRLLVKRAGTFRCPECRTVLGITEDLEITLK